MSVEPEALEVPDSLEPVADAPLLEVERAITRYPVGRGIVGAIARRPHLTVHAVEGVSFTVGPGEMVALVGESGCGKTSTAQTVVRMVDYQAGAIRFRGREIVGCPFAPRCDSTFAPCATVAPRRMETSPGHEAVCHLNDHVVAKEPA